MALLERELRAAKRAHRATLRKLRTRLELLHHTAEADRRCIEEMLTGADLSLQLEKSKCE